MAESTEGLTIVLPVFDVEKTLGKSVGAWLPTLDALQRPYEFLVVDDGSVDGTKAQAELLANRNPRIKLLTHTERRGYGACLRTAIEAATQPLFFYTSTEPGWNASDLPRMLKSLEIRDEYTGKQVEVVNGHRRGTALPKGKKRLSQLYRGFVRVVFGYWPEPPRGWLGTGERRFWWRCRILFGLRIGDINSKFKLFRRSVFDRMVIQSDGEFVHAEILAKANFLSCMMDEVPLADKQVPPIQADTRKEMWRVFRDAKFRSPMSAPLAEAGVPIPSGV
jgi:glycosyltransferase involved in cell wall biosynthesis